MSTLSVATIKSQNTLPPAVQNTSGTEIGTFCRAWVNFNGTGTVAIRASFNVSSITDGGTGTYTVNFTTAMSDANYSQVTMAGTSGSGGVAVIAPYSFTNTTSACRVCTFNTAYSGLIDIDVINVVIFR
jgi:hypothetical protein